MAEQLETYSEELSLEFESYEQLSYEDDGESHVKLFLDETPIGFVEIWTDRDNEARVGKEQEYIIINYEMIYLDSIRKK